MKRNLAALENAQFDLLVVGGGILGACVAWDAALRGLSVALVEKGDFASGTSSNSLKIVHGGLRYLQHLDLRRMRESIRERSTWLRIAPHLVEPLPILVPTYGIGQQSLALLRAALAVNDVISWDRNLALPPGRQISPGRAVSRSECLRLVPELESPALTGGVLFCDAQMYSAERLVLEVAQAASGAGANLANYVEFEAPIVRSGHVVGARVRDVLGDSHFDIRSRVVVNAAGPAAPAMAERIIGRRGVVAASYSVAMNFLVAGCGHEVAFSFAGTSSDRSATVKRGNRQLFVVPWRGHTLLGTAHYPYTGDPLAFGIEEWQVQMFLDEVNTSWPGRPFTRREIGLIHAGLLPIDPGFAGAGVSLLKRHRIVDHAREGRPGALSAISIKFTTARLVAEQLVDAVCATLGARARRCRTASTPLPGAQGSGPSVLMRTAEQRYGSQLDREVLHHLVRTYGARYERIIEYRESVADWKERVIPSAPVIKAQLVHALKEEMAQLPEDIICRRVEIGARGLLCEEAIHAASQLLQDRNGLTDPPGLGRPKPAADSDSPTPS